MMTPSDLDDDTAGPRTSRYDMIGPLGQGGMATVFLARALGPAGFARRVVVKRLHGFLEHDPSTVERLLHEARVVAHVHHANVVGIQDVVRDDAGYFLVFDYVDGDSLHGLVERAKRRGARLPPRVVGRVLLDTLAGLQAAHDARDEEGRPLGIVHRDVTPQNIIVGRDGVARLTDFGVARANLPGPVTQAGSIVGKLLYLAPECLRGERADARADLYAMGLTAWVALTGERPWASSSAGGLVLKILAEGVPGLEGRVPGASASLVEVVMRACSPDPGRRFASASAMAEALERALDGQGQAASHAEVASLVKHLVGTGKSQPPAIVDPNEVATRRVVIEPASGPPVVAVAAAASPEHGAHAAASRREPGPFEADVGVASRWRVDHRAATDDDPRLPPCERTFASNTLPSSGTRLARGRWRRRAMGAVALCVAMVLLGWFVGRWWGASGGVPAVTGRSATKLAASGAGSRVDGGAGVGDGAPRDGGLW